jgi:hypothetical protein
MTLSLFVVGAGLAVVAGLIALIVTQARRAGRIEAEKDRADADAIAKGKADQIVGERVTRQSVIDRLRKRNF